jgi:WD40 repeat protein
VTQIEQKVRDALRFLDLNQHGQALAMSVAAGEQLTTLMQGEAVNDFPTTRPLYSLATVMSDMIPELRTLNGHSAPVISANFSPDGKTVISASGDKTMKLWDVKTGKELRTLNGHLDGVNSANFSPDGKTIVSASWDKTVKLWNVETGKELRTFNGHSDTVSSANFSPDGKMVVSASRDGTVKLWRVESFEELMVRACQWLDPWLRNPDSDATDADRALCHRSSREP